MTMMSPITAPTAATISRPESDHGKGIIAFPIAAVEILSESICALDLAATMPPDDRHELYRESRMRLSAAALLLHYIDDQCSDAIRAFTREIISAAGATDSDTIRDLAARLRAAIDIELHQIRLGELYDRYA